MTLGPERLLKLVTEIKLVENLDERELTNPEGAGFDLRLAVVSELAERPNEEPFLGIEKRHTAESKVVLEYEEGKEIWLSLRPGDYRLVKTIEKINMPNDLTGHIFPRSTLFRSGVALFCTQIAPGYKGELIFGLKNLGNIEMRIQLGARIAHIQFEEVQGGGAPYRGQHQGGRISTEKPEKQI